MRIARFVAAFIFATSLIISLIIPASAAAETTSLYCDVGVANYTAPGQEGLWIDHYPTVNDDDTIFTFSSVPQTVTQDGVDYSAYTFTFVCYPVEAGGGSLPLTFEQGYVYTFNFSVLSTRLLDPELTSFSFGICQEGFTDAMPLSEVVYTIENVTSNQKRYHITTTVNVDASFPLSSMPDPNDTYVYLQMGSDWTADFRLSASQMTQKKSVGEDAYYQASLDAIENLPQSEYEFTLNKLPDAEGDVELIKGNLDEITEELHLITSDLYDVIMGIESNEPLLYFPPMKIPWPSVSEEGVVTFDKTLADLRTEGYMGNSIDGQGFFHPLTLIKQATGYVEGAESNPLEWLNIALAFVRVFFSISFVTLTLDNMLRIEWWL